MSQPARAGAEAVGTSALFCIVLPGLMSFAQQLHFRTLLCNCENDGV